MNNAKTVEVLKCANLISLKETLPYVLLSSRLVCLEIVLWISYAGSVFIINSYQKDVLSFMFLNRINSNFHV